MIDKYKQLCNIIYLQNGTSSVIREKEIVNWDRFQKQVGASENSLLVYKTLHIKKGSMNQIKTGMYPQF